MTKQIITFSFDSSDTVAAHFFASMETMASGMFPSLDVTHGRPSLDESLRNAAEQGAVVKAWVREDIESRWTDLTEDHPGLKDISDIDRAHLIDEATETGIWEDLRDCTDDDWIKVDMAIGEALTAKGIEIPGLS